MSGPTRTTQKENTRSEGLNCHDRAGRASAVARRIQVDFCVVSEDDKVPEELREALKGAAELARSKLAYTQLAMDFQLTQFGTLRSTLERYQEAQFGMLGSSVSAILAAQIGKPLSILADGWRTQLTGHMQSLAAFQAVQVQMAMGSVLPGIFAAYDVQAKTDRLAAHTEAGGATEPLIEEVDERPRRTLVRPIDVRTLSLVVLLLIAIDLTLAESRLWPEQHQIFTDLITNIGFVLAIATVWHDSHKR